MLKIQFKTKLLLLYIDYIKKPLLKNFPRVISNEKAVNDIPDSSVCNFHPGPTGSYS